MLVSRGSVVVKNNDLLDSRGYIKTKTIRLRLAVKDHHRASLLKNVDIFIDRPLAKVLFAEHPAYSRTDFPLEERIALLVMPSQV